ncbi:alcohol dehydrogenase, propanol-preferring [Izhakiella capsodis]|uniref:Alcohol dehydrogenase, propanol-preferring n=1 Tax=Izhakiella capsodis TaxID=1367852 RepID=A0A1I4YH02_9GAMM|nr:alcohol dehydrogenase, propanol-preferring [Izhakiella capsodis]
MAIQYAAAMGLTVAAGDIDVSKLKFAKCPGASVVANARSVDPAEVFNANSVEHMGCG